MKMEEESLNDKMKDIKTSSVWDGRFFDFNVVKSIILTISIIVSVIGIACFVEMFFIGFHKYGFIIQYLFVCK